MTTPRERGTNPRAKGTNPRDMTEWSHRIEAKLDALIATVNEIAGRVGAEGRATATGEPRQVPVTEAIPIPLDDGTIHVPVQRDRRAEWKPSGQFAPPETAYAAMAAARRALHPKADDE
jgi:hypothetical protein